ncbi:MAG: N-acetylmuramoyl-L-alanine amidase [Acidaminococcaceae bacterium]|nr:N-acetylmuramoyl-L-alanine amidase [Acidaminococcaceae bacterium]
MAYVELDHCRKVSLEDIRELANEARGEISMVYAHWTAARYSQAYDDYHILIDHDGAIYVTTDDLTEYKAHTYRRNYRAIGIALMCCYGALANEGYDADFGDYPPTLLQIEALAQVTAILSDALDLEITRDNFLTHCEAALADGYGPFQGDPDLRWDLWFLPDLYDGERMKPGGDLLRGKGIFYQNQWGTRGD